ncbi:MAG: N-acetyltransferase [Mesorhizobium amorphae]|nr:MAG: N-acetyltransferase [Mesorhizobium amorphae]
MRLETKRFTLRDFTEEDRLAFVAYQADARYRALYDIAEGDEAQAQSLFTLFLEWQRQHPRLNFQLGIFGKSDAALRGCGGVRIKPENPNVAVLGIELAPMFWGKHKVALEAGECLVDFGFTSLGLDAFVSDTASGNSRITKIAERYGAVRVAERAGPAWMVARGWTEVDWELTRQQWECRSFAVTKDEDDLQENDRKKKGRS